jgi:hypothetical protein
MTGIRLVTRQSYEVLVSHIYYIQPICTIMDGISVRVAEILGGRLTRCAGSHELRFDIANSSSAIRRPACLPVDRMMSAAAPWAEARSTWHLTATPRSICT